MSNESKPERMSVKAIEAWNRLDDVLRQEHQATAAMIFCVGADGGLWSVFSPSMNMVDRQALLFAFSESLSHAYPRRSGEPS